MPGQRATVKNTVISPKFLVWKLCGNCAFPQNFHTKKLGEITVIFAVGRMDRRTEGWSKKAKERRQ